MKIIKKIVLAFVALIVLSLIGGYFYFDRKFSPPENYLKVSGNAENASVKWVSDEGNPYAALLLPVELKGIKKTFYMQLDFGSPITVFYKKSLQSVQEKFPSQIDFKEDVSLNFKVKNLSISSKKFQLLDYGKKADLDNPNSVNIIGTIGTDLLEKRIVSLNFINNTCSFTENEIENGFTKFEFKKRKLLFPAKIENQDLKLLYDSGTSGYELIINKEEWQKYKLKNSKLKVEKGNSWGNVLTVISASANKKMQFGDTQLKISEVTYIEGVSKMQTFLMKRSGMQGMIGNKIFLNHKLIIDCKNERFKVE
ncbi:MULTISPECIES: hypothetical protein [unclassified Flavobacterium]|uniref:hypothetical protein n=1 Tax=unclassified Flavobacterium TaxID=196869 RepID=UPI0006ABBB6E|nr:MULTISPECIES: hypothetical protein [unclassified Flavobacterium]KOP36980.1 hypothetical protein AKO67_17330 [Flavobacterium sp. VMW]OWU89736.1 hypothetical protein APR43_16225 [Flavobacterium sp. NLM]